MKNTGYNLKRIGFLLLSFSVVVNSFSQFVHPGLTNKKSDLDRVKYMVEAQIDPWYSSYQEMVSDSKSSYDYTVRGDASFTELGRDDGTNYRAWNSDIRAAYYNAIRWYVTGDERYAEKSVEIFNVWKNLTNVTSGGTQSLSAGIAYVMIEAAEIINSTYDGWEEEDVQDFKDMLVYPGYPLSSDPSGEKTFYWMGHQGDAIRHGNQGLSGFRTVMAIGIFLDNEVIYDRALRNIQGLPHRSDDLPYPSGPNTSTTVRATGTFADTYNVDRGYTEEDYGYDEVMVHYIYENGQCQESSRDHQHTVYGIGNLTSMAEMAWSQGDDLYSHADDRLLLGLEYNMRYNVSAIRSYSDQPNPWVPTVESGEFLEGFDRTGRWYSKAMSDDGAGDFSDVRPVFEMPLAHYEGRGFKTEEEVKWITRARDVSIEESGYEQAGWSNDAIGWGALTSRRPDFCYGDPVSGFDQNGLPLFNMNVLPATIEAANFDYSPVNGEGRTYHDNVVGNKGGEYRIDEDVDIQACSEGGYALGWMEPGEWFTYTVYVPETGTYDLSIRYSANNGGGTISFSFGGEDKTGEVELPSSNGWDKWGNLSIAEGVLLKQGVQSLKVKIGGSQTAFNLKNITIGTSNSCVKSVTGLEEYLEPGINYHYYEGVWDNLPEFETLTVIDSGIVSSIGLGNGEIANGFGYVFNGYVYLENEGDYTFYTSSDDGSNLAIDGVEIVNNDGTHAAVEESGDICLQAGYHIIKVEYFEKSGGSDVLDVEYEGPSLSKREIDELFYLPSDVVLSTNTTDTNSEISVFPNPFDDIITLNNIGNSTVEILNSLGEKVYSHYYEGNTANIDLNYLGTGLYEVVITEDDNVMIKKIIKN